MPNPEPGSAKKTHAGKASAIPLEVVIITPEYEVLGIIHVPREVKEERRITDLLNDPERRFLAVTDAKLISRGSSPSSPRIYPFIQLHIDSITMIHPSTQTVLRNTEYSREEGLRFDDFRAKMNRSS